MYQGNISAILLAKDSRVDSLLVPFFVQKKVVVNYHYLSFQRGTNKMVRGLGLLTQNKGGERFTREGKELCDQCMALKCNGDVESRGE